MKAAGSSETSVHIPQNTRRHIQKTVLEMFTASRTSNFIFSIPRIQSDIFNTNQQMLAYCQTVTIAYSNTNDSASLEYIVVNVWQFKCICWLTFDKKELQIPPQKKSLPYITYYETKRVENQKKCKTILRGMNIDTAYWNKHYQTCNYRSAIWDSYRQSY
jgi:hypothetical protein